MNQPDTTTASTLAAANAAFERGDLTAAEDGFRTVLARVGPEPSAILGLGRIADRLGHPTVALQLIEQAAAQPAAPLLAHLLAGEQRQRRADWPAALAHYRRAAPDAAGMAALRNNLGRCLVETGDLAGAEFEYRAAVALEPSWGGIWSNLGATAFVRRRPVPAARWHRRAMTLEPAAPNVLSDAAVAADDPVVADRLLCRALCLVPDYAEAWLNLGNARNRQSDLAGAEKSFLRAETLRPDEHRAAFNRGLVRLSLGDCAAGFALYERRLLLGVGPAVETAPAWRGEDLRNRTLLVGGEQGFGDVIQFARFLPALARRGARILLRAPVPLHALMATLPGLDGVIDMVAPTPPMVDFVTPLIGLPHRLGCSLDDLGREVPYLRVDPAVQAKYRDRLPPGPKIGLVWAGNPVFDDDRFRSPGLAPLLPLFDLPVTWVLLQQGPGRADLDGRRLPANVVDIGSLPDFAATAAVMAELDLVLSSCTATAHLAGALARPLWVLLSAVADWRWLRDRPDSPWYPTARLFRQKRLGDWSELAVEVGANLVRAGFTTTAGHARTGHDHHTD